MRLDFAPFSATQATGLPGAQLRNLFPQSTPSGPSPSALLSRPCLEAVYSLGVSGIRGLYQQDGVFGGDIFAVCGTTLYRGEMSLGTVALGSYARFVSSPTQLVVVVGGSAYCYDGSTLATIDVDGSTPIDVALLGDRFYFPVVEEIGRVYFSEIDDATDIDGLSFFTADSTPDGIVAIGPRNGRLIIWGRTSTEFWQQTGDQDAPLVRSQGSEYGRGAKAIRAIVGADNRDFWVGDDLKIYTQGAPDRVSTHALEEKLRLCAQPGDINGFASSWDGNDFVAFNIPGQGTWALHIESGEWGEWTSHQRTTFRCQTGIMVAGAAYLGDSLSGTVYRLADIYQDDDEPVERLASCIGPAGFYASLELEAAMGVGLVGNAAPTIEMRYSDDQGRTWTAWKARSLGLIGRYRNRVLWNRLGLAKRPRVFEFRVTDPVKVVLVGVEANVQ